MSKKTSNLTFRQELILKAPPRPDGWTSEEEFSEPEPVLSEYHRDLITWKHTRDHRRRFDFLWPSTKGECKEPEEEPQWVMDKLKAWDDAVKAQSEVDKQHREWSAIKNAWLDSKWRCYWADLMIEEANK